MLSFMASQQYKNLLENLFEKDYSNENLWGGLYTSIASEESLARSWLTQEEEKAWAHLQKEI